MAKIAVITGGSRGLGRAAVLALAKRGVNSIFTYNSDSASSEKVVASVEELGAKAIALQLDVSKPDTLDAFVSSLKDALSKWGVEKFDFLINNAGVGSHSGITDTTPEVLDSMYNIHFKSPFFLIQKTLDIINDNGRILNVSSGLTRFSFQGYIAYASMKGAIETATKYLAKELGPRGIKVNVIAPGAIATDFGGGAVRDSEEMTKMISSITALGRPGEAEEIGDLMANLLGEDCRWITGERIEASGGTLL